MKKILLYTVLLLLTCEAIRGQSEISASVDSYRDATGARLMADAEIFQATIKAGANANQFLIYLKPSQLIPIGSIIVAGAPQVAFSILGTGTFTATYAFGANTLNSSTQIAGGRSRMVVGPLGNTAGITLPWPINQERLAYTINITGDDTVGARLETDNVNFGQYILFMGEETTSSDWTNYTDPFYTGGPGSVEGQDGIFAYVTMPSIGAGPLPVIFGSYDVICNDRGALIVWSTVTEQNSDRFEIQRSSNGTDWTTVDIVAAAGNSDALLNYQYLDLHAGTSFYRIRQVDKDERFVYTAIKRTDCKAGKVGVALYPVPAKDYLNVVIKSDIEVKTVLQILDMNGKTVRRLPTQVKKGNNHIILNVNDLPAGQYMLSSSELTIQINKPFTIIR